MTDIHALGDPLAPGDGPLAVFLHGYGSDERDLASLSTYLPGWFRWVSLRAPLRHPSFGYSWYPLDSTFHPGAHIEAATSQVWEWVDATVPNDTMLIPIGFSQGAMMASQLLRTRPKRIAATVLLSGYVADVSQPADADLAESLPRVFWGRGDRDEVIPAAEVRAAEAWLTRHASVDSHVYEGMAHSVSEQELADVRAFLTDATR